MKLFAAPLSGAFTLSAQRVYVSLLTPRAGKRFHVPRLESGSLFTL